ncbi:hypothetical protein M8523_32490 [Hyphomicrobiales bacterium BP6-180914]|uniref:Uncharacterized protein n=1 Tax=Lichenifustis flavocetrariae TaxID=2949735 RepID=A0AA41Z1S5_9HYPH|nr:hypothetical protein [Lichenifustis flavocetrariae]
MYYAELQATTDFEYRMNVGFAVAFDNLEPGRDTNVTGLLRKAANEVKHISEKVQAIYS